MAMASELPRQGTYAAMSYHEARALCCPAYAAGLEPAIE
jgi:hypothetical protein